MQTLAQNGNGVAAHIDTLQRQLDNAVRHVGGAGAPAAR